MGMGIKKKINFSSLENAKADVFYKLTHNTIKNIKDVLIWADKNGERTDLLMRDDSWNRIMLGKVQSDKDFKALCGLINRNNKTYFRIILRKEMNLFAILYNEKVIKDILEIVIRGIDVGSKEYFIRIYLQKKFLKELSKSHIIEKIG
jgi:hypothetical protein